MLLPAENLLGRCPTCFENFRRSICDLTCHPQQSKFLKPTLKQDAESTYAVYMYM